MQTDWPILSVLMWLPIVGGVLVLALGEQAKAAGRWLALLTSVATFVISTFLFADFDRSTAALQFVERMPWIRTFFVSDYYLGVDGISMPLIVLTAFITPMVVISAWSVIEKKVSQYFAAFLI